MDVGGDRLRRIGPRPGEQQHRVAGSDAMLLGAVVLWSLNTTVTKYVLIHGWRPVAFAAVRYLGAIVLFWATTLHRERTLRVARADVGRVCLAALFILLNQLCYVYSLKLTSAATAALVFGTTPVFVALLARGLGLERPTAAFWLGGAVTLAGIAVIAPASGSFGSGFAGIVLAAGAALTWACYSLAVGPLMRRYSALRISAVVLPVGWVPLGIIGGVQLASQRLDSGGLVWLALVYGAIGPIFLTNIIWFSAIDRVGASRASLFANLQPFVGVIFAVVLLAEAVTPLEFVGGVLIVAGIALERVAGRRA